MIRLRGLVAMGVAAVGLTALAAPAFANSASSTTGSSVSWNSSTHVMTICDTSADGYNPYAWWNPNTSHNQPTNRLEPSIGNGNCQDYPGLYSDGTKISFQACRNVTGNPDNCGDWQTDNF